MIGLIVDHPHPFWYEGYMPEELKTLHVRITSRRGKRVTSFTEAVDLDDEREMWKEWTTNGANPHLEGQTFESHHAPVRFPIERMGDYNGHHFIFGYLECLGQSDDCPSFLRERSDEEIVEVLWNADL